MLSSMPQALPASADARPSAPASSASVPPRDRGMTFGHELLLALIMAIAMGATVFLYR
jgi:hypothetical protein